MKKSQGVPEKGEMNYKEKYKESEYIRIERKTVIKKVTVKRKEVESSKEIKAADSNKIEGIANLFGETVNMKKEKIRETERELETE